MIGISQKPKMKLKIKYSASALFDINNIELFVSDDATEEDILRSIVDDLMDRYNLRINYTKEIVNE